ncbi:MAG: YidC/Oxa1 family insertase periplasmic-domain containing protein, partial [Planctomycetota bacterium]
TNPDTGKEISPAGYEVVESKEENKDSNVITFRTILSDNISLIKRFTFHPDAYHLNFEIEFENHSDSPAPIAYELSLPGGISLEKGSNIGGAVVAHHYGKSVDLTEVAIKDIIKKKKLEYTAGIAWCGLVNRYFACVLCPNDDYTRNNIDSAKIVPTVDPDKISRNDDPQFFKVPVEQEEKSEGIEMLNAAVSIKSKQIELQPGEKVTHSYFFYVGPKDIKVLDNYKDFGLTELMNYGRFGFLSKFFLWILHNIYSLLPNYGVAIIILTLLVRGALHPISKKQQMSLLKHQRALSKLQPELTKLKEKYKNNKQKLYLEQSKLHKEHGISMLPGGCLLLLLQIPVFIGLYSALNVSIELRHAPFFLWMKDLSQPDGISLPRLGFSLPIIGNVINILPLIMIVIMFIQSMFQPKPTDPQQAQSQKITMIFMYIFFGVIFYSVPSGLVLYFLTSSLIGLLESYVIRNSFPAAEVQTQ